MHCTVHTHIGPAETDLIVFTMICNHMLKHILLFFISTCPHIVIYIMTLFTLSFIWDDIIKDVFKGAMPWNHQLFSHQRLSCVYSVIVKTSNNDNGNDCAVVMTKAKITNVFQCVLGNVTSKPQFIDQRHLLYLWLLILIFISNIASPFGYHEIINLICLQRRSVYNRPDSLSDYPVR